MMDVEGLEANSSSKENQELKRLFKQDFIKYFVDSKDIEETFDQFPYYLRFN